MKKRILSMLLAIVMVVGLVPGFTITASAAEITPTAPTLTMDKYDINGDDTMDAVYEIKTAAELYWFAGLVNGTLSGVTKNNSANAILMNNITVNENVIVDGALISDTSSLNVWTAMGKTVFSSGWFGGCFDGNGKTISGLYVNETNNYRGFIGCLGEGASIKNLTITNSYFASTSSSLGAFVGTMGLNSAAENPVIENCKLIDSVVSGTSYVGGIVGGGDYGEIISNCHVYNCTITGTGDNVGGIAGSAGDYNNEAYIRLCSVNDSSVSGANTVGGILGKGGRLTKTKISACCNYNTSVTATTKNAGGIIGSDAACYSCFVTAEVSAPSKQGPFAGYGNNYSSAYDSDVYGEVINYTSSKAFTTEEIKAGVATYYLTDKTASNTVYVLWGQKIGEDNYPSWNPEGNQDYIVYRKDDTENGGYIYYNGDAAAEYKPNEDGIYEIADRSDWYKFAKKAKENPTIDGILTANIDFTGVASDKLANYVIGVDGKAYTGTFDGDGYTVSNLPEATQPLFNIIGNGGELKDLNLSGATVTNTDTVGIAGLVYNNLGTISNVTVSDVTVSSTTIAAAIVAYNRGVVTGCTASDITVTGKSTAGGIVGVNDSGHTIEDCHVLSGTVKAGTAEYDAMAGGICGSSYGGTIKGCTNNADVSADGGRLETAAGIVGRPNSYNNVSVKIIACSNTGNINGSWAGGISGADSTATYINISLCYNEGAVTGSAAGGIAANGSINFDDLIVNCYNTGLITATSKAGGIVGDGANNTVKNCHNYGKVVSQDIGAPIAASDRDTWLSERLINNYGIEGNVEASYVSSYYDTSSGEHSTAIRVGSTREEFADGTITAKLNAGNSGTVWYQYTEYPILEERHIHQWSYILEGTDTIKAECALSGCDLVNSYGGSVTIAVPDELLYDGESKDAECAYDNWLPNKPTIVYNEVDRVNVTGNDITASITLGEGNDAVTASVSYQILPREIPADKVTLSRTSASYNGTEYTVAVTVKDNTNKTLTADVDYEITGTTAATEISTGNGYAVTVTGKGNYFGTVTKYWKINKGSLSTQLKLEGWNYLDTPNEPSITNNPDNAEVTYTYYVSTGRSPVMTGTANGAQTEGGVPSYAGTYYIGAVIAATEHYNSKTISPIAFTIVPREVTNPTFEGLQDTYPYDNGNEIKPTFTLKDDLGNEIPASEYTVSYSNNTNGGEATITISDTEGGNYNVSGSKTFEIVTHIHNWNYELDGTDTIKATCSNTDGKCDNTNGGSIKITANNSTYAPNTPNAANLTNANGGDAVVIGDLTELPTIQYQKKSGEEWGTATTAPTDAGTYKASITVGTDKIAFVEYTIAKAEAEIPTGLTAVYGQTLANVSLPTGWIWVNSASSVGNVGNQTHKANYAGDDNHNAANDVELTITVTQSGATMTATADKNSYTYGEDITVTVNIAPTAASPVLFMAPPAADQIAIYNGSTQLTEPQPVGSQPMTFTVTGLDVGTYTLTAKYIAGNMEGKTANTQEITITKATPTITTLPTAGIITYGQTLNDSTLIGGEASVDGTFAWADANTVPTVSGGSTGYEVIFTPDDTTNYTTATVTVALPVNPKDITGALVGTFADMTYNGMAQTPSATVTIYGLTAEGSWSEVTNVTDLTTFTASGNFTGKIENQNPGMQKLSLNGATVTLEDDSLIYNGSAQSVTITDVKVGNVTVPADAYGASDNTGTEVGNYTLTITANEGSNFTDSATKVFTITQSGSEIGDDSIKVYHGETETTDFTYGDVITVKAQVAPAGSAPSNMLLLAAPAANQMALFYNGTQISEAVYAVNGVYTMTYSTTDKVVPVGTGITLTAKYVGNTNMADTEKNVTVSMAAKPLTVDFAAATGREYAASNTSVVITDVTISGKALDSDDVSVDTTNLTGSLASDNAGTYTKVTLPALTLTGDHKDYYIISGGEVDTNVAIAQITGTTSVNASPVTYSDISAKTQDLADVVASFKNGTEALTYTVASKSSEIASASIDGSQLTFNLASGLTDAGTAAITVDVTGFTNYSKVTVTVDIELTDKTTVTVDMSDVVLVNRDFNGEALTYTGEAKADGYIGAFTYTWQDAEGNALTEAPTDAGTYRLVASVSDTVFYAGSNYVTVTIAPKEVTVTALDKSAYVGSTAPDLSAPVAGKDYTISGLVDDTVVTVILSCTPDMSKAGEYAITSSASEESGNYTFTYVNGKLTVSYIPYIPSTPSAPTTQKVTVPISSDEETIHVDTKVKGDTATIDHVNLNHLDTVIGDHVEEIGTVTIDFSVLDKPITTVEIPTNAVKEIADAVNDPHNDAHSFEVILTDGTSIDFDAEAMAEMAVQADGKDITISIVSHEDAKLTSAQEYVVGDHVAFDINVTSGGEHISDMGGKVSVHVPYELKQGERAGGIVVYYVDDFGNRERCETSYDSIKKRVNFKTDHLSLYMIDCDASLAESCDGVTNCPSKAFSDLDTSLWYHEATDYVLENGLMNGVGNNLFDPNGTTSRAMIVTILWRLEGEPVVNYLMQFEDVAAETWYTEAVRWAASEGIVEGYSNTSFGPNDPITREQLATILYRYEQHKGGGFTGAWMFLLDYTDRDKVSDWAYEAMCWTTMHGVINGKGDGILDPKGNAKRCEAAQMLMNYLNK